MPHKPGKENDFLRELLRRKISEIQDEVEANTGLVSEQDLDNAERLARLVELREKTRQTDPLNRWVPAALLSGALIIVSMLLFLHLRETEVEMDLALSEAGFSLTEPQVLTDIVNLSELRASGVRGLQFTDGSAIEGDAGHERDSVFVSIGANGPPENSITLSPIALNTGSQIRVVRSNGGYVLSLKSASANLRVTLAGSVLLDGREVKFKSPRALTFDINPEGTDIGIVPQKRDDAGGFSPQLRVRNLSLSRIDDFTTSSGTLVQNVSTIVSGKIYFESLDASEYPLRSSELIHFGNIEGRIHNLGFRDGRIHLNFRGTARDMAAGWGERPRNIMPTYLDWFHARHGLSLLWGSALYLFGLMAALQRWLKPSQ